MEQLGFIDLLMGPLYLGIIYLIAYRLRKKFTTRETREYFFKALHLKMIGAIMLGIIFQYYYGFGDSLLFHYLGGFAYTSFSENFEAFIHLTFYPIVDYDPVTASYTSGNIFYVKKDHSTYFVIRIIGVLSVINFHSYMASALVFGFASFIGAWLMFLTFIDIYPKLIKKFAIAVFFLPSVFFWGSGLMKDSLCFGALGITFYGFYWAVIKRRRMVANGLLAAFGMLLLFKIKIYILLCFIPMLAIWTYLQYLIKIKSAFLKFVLAPFILVISLGLGVYAVLTLSQNSGYEVDNLAAKTRITSNYLQSMSQQGSIYNLGEFDGSITSLLSYFPQAVAVSLYRPFLWEARNPLSLLSAIEASYFIWLTLLVFVKVKIKNFIKTFLREPIVLASLSFAISFSFAVGINSGNFGSLVRYKIPMMPFYIGALMIMLESNRKKTVTEQSIELLKLREKEENIVEEKPTQEEEQTANDVENEYYRRPKIPKKFRT
jgi:hypothetical protein